ncbi:MAG: fibronectin type III domain-containing protein [Flavobacteriales bacterium]|nr:fibronectin type III domain-containing protein [Flavobacteriales bacterium]
MSRTNVEMLTNNVAFTTPNPTLAAMTAATDKLEAAIDRYNFSRSRLDKQDRDEAFVSLKTMRADLGAYVQTTSAGDADLITSAGFKMEKARQPIGQLPAPPNVRALVRPYPGSLELRFGGVKGRLSYKTYICMGDPKVEANWQLHSVTGKTRVIIDGLQSDQVYYFRVAALGAAGLSPMSDVSSAKAA